MITKDSKVREHFPVIACMLSYANVHIQVHLHYGILGTTK